MEFQFTLYSLIYLLAGMITLIPVWTSWHMREFPGVYSLFWMMLFMSIWSLLCAFEMTLLDMTLKQAVLVLEDGAFLIFSGMLCFFILDYFLIGGWFTPVMRRWFGLVLGGVLILDMTNSWHGLIYQSFRNGPPGSNLLFFSYGPLYFGIITSLYAINLVLLIIAGYFAVQKSGRLRDQARFIFTGIFSYCLSMLLYVFIPDQAIGLSILPIGSAVCGMLISWVVFADLLGQFKAQAEELQTSRDNLAARLISQQQKVSGMYDLVYLNTGSETPENLTREALQKMRRSIGCDAAAFFLQLENQYLLDSESGMEPGQKQALTVWTIPEPGAGPGLVDWPSAPVELQRVGFQGAASKWVTLSTGQSGSIFYLWRAGHSLQVEDIALMSAQVDVLGMIIENDHSRRLAQEMAILDERQRLGRELHDRISQDLFSLSIFGANSIHHAAAGFTAALADDLKTINTLTQQALNEMRLLLFELQPSGRTDSLPLEEAIQKRFSIVESRVNIQTDLVISGCETLPPAISQVLYGVVVEALNNTVKHSRAKTVSISIQGDGQEVRLEIQDDGIGFDPQACGSRRGLGLGNMSRRVEQVNGSLQIISEIGKGTFIAAVLPLSAGTALPAAGNRLIMRGL